MFLDCSQAQICQVILLFAVRENYPIHYFCSLGKDRTGIITGLCFLPSFRFQPSFVQLTARLFVALVMCCCDADRDQICNDYSRSREVPLHLRHLARAHMPSQIDEAHRTWH